MKYLTQDEIKRLIKEVPNERYRLMFKVGFLHGLRVSELTALTKEHMMQRAGTRAGIPIHKLHPHALKHSCAMESIDKIGIQRVRQYLGHKSIQSTGEYLKESDESASRAFASIFGS